MRAIPRLIGSNSHSSISSSLLPFNCLVTYSLYHSVNIFLKNSFTGLFTAIPVPPPSTSAIFPTCCHMRSFTILLLGGSGKDFTWVTNVRVWPCPQEVGTTPHPSRIRTWFRHIFRVRCRLVGWWDHSRLLLQGPSTEAQSVWCPKVEEQGVGEW